MDKVRYAGDLSQDEAPDLLQAYPEEEPIVEDEIFDLNQESSSNQGPDPNTTSKQTSDPVLPTETSSKTVLPTQSRGRRGLQHKQNMPSNGSTHRYVLCNR